MDAEPDTATEATPGPPARTKRVPGASARAAGEWDALRPAGLGQVHAAAAFERRVNAVRLGIAVLVVAISSFDPSRHVLDIALAGILVVVGVGVAAALRAGLSARGLRRLGFAVTAADCAVTIGFVFGNLHTMAGDLWTVVLLPTAELACRYGTVGGVLGGSAAGLTGIGWTLGHGATASTGELLTTLAFRAGIMVLVGTGGGLLISRVNRRSRALRRTLDLSRDLVSVLGVDGTVLYINRACEDILGYGPEELVGRPFWDLQLPEDRPAEGPPLHWRKVLDRRNLIKNRLVRKDGTVVWFEHSSLPLPEEGIVHCVSRDITERRRADSERRAAIAALEENEDRLRMTLEQTETFTWEYEIDANQLVVSDSFKRTFGLGSRSLRTTDEFMERIHVDDREELLAAMVGAVEGTSGAFDAEFRMLDVEGRWCWISTRCRVLTDPSGRRRLVGTGVDVTARRQATEALKRNEEAFRATIETTTDAFVGAESEGRITDWNHAAESMFGWTRDEVIGRRIADLIVPLEHRDAHEEALSRSIADTGRLQSANRRLQLTARRRDGEVFPVEVTVTSVPGSEGPRFHAFVRDISEQLAYEAELSARALSDGLTGLPNRTLLMSRLEQALARLDRDPGKVAIMFVDLDRFKEVNDSLGHGAGDRLLTSLARNLSGAMRTSDTVARFGGDELIVLCERVDTSEEVEGLARRLLEAVSLPVAVEDREVVLHASIGVAVTERADTDPESLIQQADAAMYRAKERGRGRYEMFDEQMRTRATAYFEMESDLRQALAGDQLRLHFQPLVTVPGERVVGAEALVRWQHPTKGLVLPSEFIPLAEETGLIVPIGAWVLDEACRQLSSWRRRHPGAESPTLSVNVSALQLARPGLARDVAEALDRHGLEPESLCLEATESVLLDGATSARESLDGLRALGVAILVDDFGTGYSSLANLRAYPVSGLKIDRAFVSGLGTDPTAEAIVEAVVGMAHALGMVVVAEGVQSRGQLDVLEHLGCDMAQGFYWSRARDEEGFEAILNLLDVAGRDAVTRIGAPGDIPALRALHGQNGRVYPPSPRPPAPPAAATS